MSGQQQQQAPKADLRNVDEPFNQAKAYNVAAEQPGNQELGSAVVTNLPDVDQIGRGFNADSSGNISTSSIINAGNTSQSTKGSEGRMAATDVDVSSSSINASK